jgi:hypothetical protein
MSGKGIADLVYTTHANSSRPSAAATPSRAFNSPLRLSVFTSESCSLLRPRRDELDVLGLLTSCDSSPLPLVQGEPESLLDRVTLRVKAASRSSRRRMHRAGTRPINVVRVLSLIHEDDNEMT